MWCKQLRRVSTTWAMLVCKQIDCGHNELNSVGVTLILVQSRMSEIVLHIHRCCCGYSRGRPGPWITNDLESSMKT